MKWTDELIESELRKVVDNLYLKRMPTANELKNIGRNDLHCKISRTKKYSGWAEVLGLPLKRSDTVVGHENEFKILKLLNKIGHTVERMTTKHPYDLLINGRVKVDVKFSKSYLLKGQYKTNTFNLSKRYPTCDIYILVSEDHETGEEKIYVIPSHLVQMTMINMGVNTKYKVYENKFDYIKKYSEFFASID